MANQFVAGDTASKLRVTLKDSTTKLPLDLTGSLFVRLRWRMEDGLTTHEGLMTGPGGAAFDATGVVEYRFTGGELYAPTMAFEIKITNAAGEILRNQELIVEQVRPSML